MSPTAHSVKLLQIMLYFGHLLSKQQFGSGDSYWNVRAIFLKAIRK